MNSIKLILTALFFNLLVAVAGIAGNINNSNMDSILTNFNSSTASYHNYALNLKNSNDFFAASIGSALFAVEGIINIIIFITFFVGLIFSSVLMVPAVLSAGTTSVEKFIGAMISLLIIINNIVLIQQLYFILINRKVE